MEGGLYTDALYATSAEGHAKIVRILVEHGADVNTRGGIHVNAFQEAPFQDHKHILRPLVLTYLIFLALRPNQTDSLDSVNTLPLILVVCLAMYPQLLSHLISNSGLVGKKV